MMIKPATQSNSQGFTFIELLVAAVIGMITIMAAGQTMVSQIESSQKINRRERLRSDWVTANQFISAEINKSIKIATDADNELIEDCGIDSNRIKMVIQFHRSKQIKPAIYYTSQSENGWADFLLKRCGPAINSNGDYVNILSNEIIVDNLTGVDSGFTVLITDEKFVQFNIALKGLDLNRYKQQIAARSYLQNAIIRPRVSSICFQDTQIDIDGVKINLTSDSNEFTSEQDQELWDRKTNGDALICGHGGGDTIAGGRGNNLIEAGGIEGSILDGGNGDDRIIGSHGNDIIRGGDGEDTLISLHGNDIMRGGEGTNHYVPGIDSHTNSCDRDQVIGLDDAFDIIYFKEVKDNYQLSNPCNNSTCRVILIDSQSKKSVDIKNGNLLVFSNESINLPEGEEFQLPLLDPNNCINQISTLDPPPPPIPEEDPRFTELRPASIHAKNLLLEAQENFRPSDYAYHNILNELDDRFEEAKNNLPPEISENFCIWFTRSLTPKLDRDRKIIKPEILRWVNYNIWIHPKNDNPCTGTSYIAYGGRVRAGRRMYPAGNTAGLVRIADIQEDRNDRYYYCNITFMRFEMRNWETDVPYKIRGC